MSIKMLV